MKIEIKDLVHEYLPGMRALDGVNLTLDGTAPVAIIGQNGAGKTTLVKHFDGILCPTSGQVLLDGHDINERSCAQWSAHVGYVFQNPDNQLFLESVRHELEFGPRQLGVSEAAIAKRVERVAKLVGLSRKLDVNPADLTPAEKKFCAIGSVLTMKPEVVIFDEPTCGQDLAGNARLERIIRALRKSGRLCITISHDAKFVCKCFERVVVMCHGRVLVEGSVEEVFSQPELLKQSYVIPAPVTRVASAAGMNKVVFDVDSLIEGVKAERSS